MQGDNSDKKEKLMCTKTKYRESVPGIPRETITSRLGRWEGGGEGAEGKISATQKVWHSS